MTVVITIEEVGARDKRVVEVRRVTAESHKRLTAHAATRILRREFPDFPKCHTASKVKDQTGVFHAMHSLTQTEKCSFHYNWRHYYLAEATASQS